MKNKLFIFTALLALTIGTFAAGIDHEAKEAYRDRLEQKAAENAMREALMRDAAIFKAEVEANKSLLTGGRFEANQECISLNDADLTLFCQYVILMNYKVTKDDIQTLRKETGGNFVSMVSQLSKLLTK